MENIVPLVSQEHLYMLEDQFVSLHSPNNIIHAPLDTLGQFQRLKALLGSFNPSYGPLLINKSIISFLKGRKIYLRIYQLSLVLVFTRDQTRRGLAGHWLLFKDTLLMDPKIEKNMLRPKHRYKWNIKITKFESCKTIGLFAKIDFSSDCSMRPHGLNKVKTL